MLRYLLALTLLVTASYGQDKPADQPSTPPANTQATSPNNSAPNPTLRVLKRVAPIYPFDAGKGGIQGKVVLRVLVSETGDVESAEVVSGEKELIQSALDAAKKWKFEPFVVNGKAIKVRTNLPFDFYFSGNATDYKDKPPTPSANPATGDAKAGSSDKPLPTRVRVSSGILPGLILHQVQPIYPPEARANHIHGTVVLHAIIGNDGLVKSLTVVAGPKELTQAAIGAVEQWTYRPYTLAGKPVEIDTTVEIHFNLF